MGLTSLSKADGAKLKAAINSYKYVSPNLSLAERLFLNDFWGWWASNYPMWLAPNLITFIGFLACLFSTVLMFYYSPNLDGSTPRWWYLCCGCTAFIYQTFDGSDGKQARRTKSGSALGELFDHGCDALVTTWALCFAVEMVAVRADSTVFILALIGSQTCFFVSNLTLLHMGYQHFNQVDAQEFQIFLQVSLWSCYFFGNDVFKYVIPMPASVLGPITTYAPTGIARDFTSDGLSVAAFLVFCSLFSVIANIISGLFFVVKFYLKEKPQNVETGRGIDNLFKQVGLVGTVGVFTYIAWYYAVQDKVDPRAVMGVILVSGLAHGDLMFHLLVTRVCHLPVPDLVRSRGVWAVVFLAAVNYLHFSGLLPGSSIGFLRQVALWSIVASNLQYVYSMGNAIADVLEINIFSLKKHKQ